MCARRIKASLDWREVTKQDYRFSQKLVKKMHLRTAAATELQRWFKSQLQDVLTTPEEAPFQNDEISAVLNPQQFFFLLSP